MKQNRYYIALRTKIHRAIHCVAHMLRLNRTGEVVIFDSTTNVMRTVHKCAECGLTGCGPVYYNRRTGPATRRYK
jgi:ribosomal protein L30/L7E